MPRVVYGQLNFAENNFHILRANIRDLIRGKKCNVRNGAGDDDFVVNKRFSLDDD